MANFFITDLSADNGLFYFRQFSFQYMTTSTGENTQYPTLFVPAPLQSVPVITEALSDTQQAAKNSAGKIL
jgi:hypothetical protein